MGKAFFFAILILGSLGLSAQHKYDSKVMDNYPSYYRDTITNKKSGLLAKHFEVFREANLDMNKNEEFFILLNLKRGEFYHFLIFADISTTKVEMKLGMEGVGHIITDKYKPTETGEFFTEYSFICPRDGQYILTLFQRTKKMKPLGHFVLLKRTGVTESGEFRLK